MTNNKLIDEKIELDDETLGEMIEFRRETLKHHIEQENKVQATLHKLVLMALIELQERRKADSADFRKNENSSTSNFREITETSTSHWIKCSEQMPPVGEPVIAAFYGTLQSTIYFWNGQMWDDLGEQFDPVYPAEITQWMPLQRPQEHE